jgi:hypothetical protein
MVDFDDVGPLPTLPPPCSGERLQLKVTGRPPIKTVGRSMRNPSSPQWHRFMALRHAAIEGMGGRKWYEGPVALRLLYMGPKEGMSSGLLSYLGGIMDTLDGSQGPSIMYLPIAYLDDCQVVESSLQWIASDTESYELEIEFLG